MSKFRKGILVLMVLTGAASSHWLVSQDSGIDAQSLVKIPASPEASGLIQYGNTDVNMNLGRPNISVPIYTHQGREMQLPILLSYDASGIKPTQLASRVGLGWALVAGGTVTRVKLGMADDDSNLHYNTTVNSSGIQDMVGVSHSDGLAPEEPIDALAIRSMLLSLQDNGGAMTGDHQPDAYSFSTGTGLSGTVYVDYENDVAYSMEDPTIKVEAVGPSIVSPTMWRITDASGTEYQFSVGEETKYSIEDENNAVLDATYISAWYLTKIISPNKKDEYTFAYSTEGYWQEQEDSPDISAVQDRPSSTNCTAIINDEVETISSTYNISQRLLTSVTWNGKKLADFTYNGKLNEISISYGTTAIRGYDLTHSGDFLNALTLKDSSGVDSDQTWGFEYYDPTGMAGNGTMDVDYWGYYNAKSNTTFVPAATWGANSYLGADKSPDLAATRKGTIKKINFPTGGYEEFTYELHELNPSTKIGGLRIAKIESKQADGTVASTRTYEYEEAKKLQPTNFTAVKTELKWVNNDEFFCNTFNRYTSNTATSVGPDIAYDKVTERRMDGTASNGYTIYKFFTSYFDGNDDRPYRFGSLFNGKLQYSEVYDSIDSLLQKTENFYYSTKLSSVLAGMENAKAVFFSTDTTVIGHRLTYQGSSDSKYYYEYIPWDSGVQPTRCNIGDCGDDGPQPYPVYRVNNYSLDSYFFRLYKTVSTSYYGGTPMVAETLYDHNTTTHFQMTTQTVEDSNGDDWISKYYYPGDVTDTASLPGGNIEGYELAAVDTMKANHQINTVLQSEKFKDTVLLSRQRTNFKNWSADLVFAESVETSLLLDTLEKRVEYVSYYPNGNPREVRQVNGNSIVYIWGYDSQFPVAQVQNTDYATIEELSSFGASFDLGSNGLSSTQKAQLRTIPNALVTTMDFVPGIGMTVQTTPNGLTTFYEYDKLGRLKYIKDQDNNILKKNEYVYKVNASTVNN